MAARQPMELVGGHAHPTEGSYNVCNSKTVQTIQPAFHQTESYQKLPKIIVLMLTGDYGAALWQLC
jgi:hypothetical protein